MVKKVVKKWSKSGQTQKMKIEKNGSGQKKWANGHFFFKSGQPESLEPQGFRAFLAKNPLFFINNPKKLKLYTIVYKIKNINKVCEKNWAFDQNTLERRKIE